MVYFEGGEPHAGLPGRAGRGPPRPRGSDSTSASSATASGRRSVDDALVWLAPFAELGVADLGAVVVCLLHRVARRRDPPAQRHARRPAARPADGRARGRRTGGAGRPRRAPAASPAPDHVQGAGGAGARLRRAPRRPPETLDLVSLRGLLRPRPRSTSAATATFSSVRASAPATSSRRRSASSAPLYDPRALPVVREIHAGGPWELAGRSGRLRRQALYADECHLCYELRDRLRAAESPSRRARSRPVLRRRRCATEIGETGS